MNDNSGGEYNFEEYANYTMFVRVSSKSFLNAGSSGEEYL
jgi:hypothetical protein